MNLFQLVEKYLKFKHKSKFDENIDLDKLSLALKNLNSTLLILENPHIQKTLPTIYHINSSARGF